MLVVHANWSGSQLHLWGEEAARWAESLQHDAALDAARPGPHPFVCRTDDLRSILGEVVRGAGDGSLTLRLPTLQGRPLPSPALAHYVGRAAEGDVEDPTPPTTGAFTAPTLTFDARDVSRVLDALEDLVGAAESEPGEGVSLAESARYFALAARLARSLAAQHRVVPLLLQEPTGALRGMWRPWLADEATLAKAARIAQAMPVAARAVADGFEHHAWSILDDFLGEVTDALARRVFESEGLLDAIEGREPGDDPHVAWLAGLLGTSPDVPAGGERRGELVKGVRRWIGGLEERGSGTPWRLLLRVSEPLDAEGLGDFSAGETVRWTLSLHLRSVANPRVEADADEIWALPTGSATVQGMRLEQPQETLLAELARASRLYKKLESVLEETDPTQLDLSTSDAYRFLREYRPALIEQGFSVEAPEWWDSPTVRLGARLQVESEDIDPLAEAGLVGVGPSPATTRLGLTSLVNYRWQMAVGETTLTLEQFEKLAAQHSPLIRLGGRWVEIRPEDIKAAVRFVRENPGGRIELGRALRLAYASDPEETGVPIIGMDATGWVARVFTDARANESMSMLEPPKGFVGTLRPYQLKGLSWLAFLDRLGLGACLADDMGLGKTIQLLALLAWERVDGLPAPAAGADGGAPAPARVPPTLLVVPTSVVPNWVYETRRFTPELKVHVHHGPERPMGEKLLEAAANADLVITTYALAHRDRAELEKIGWSRVCLDEAQNIKNPGAKQTRALHAISSPRRVALTGTPVENRLGELWSIMDFLNPGYLGPAGEFRRKFAVPIERYHDRHRGAQLRGLVQPFVLRRLKSDPAVITDLPEKVESKEFCFLTPEQAGLYQACVADMISAAERSEGIQRRGVVLAGLIKLKQICNHPGQFLKEWLAGEGGGGHAGSGGSPPPDSSRSGKCQRLLEMLDEVNAAGDKALVFTQFRQMGHALAAMIRHRLNRDALFLHGGTPSAQRQALINEFQSDSTAAPIFVLSLKAGGVGLNLTAANHVFHFDRWWNPAVEAQATDRAFRIGQTRTVQVHKFVVSGTLEERIDQMIEAKTELADLVIGAGEQWLTELDTSQLRDLLSLRPGAVEEADE